MEALVEQLMEELNCETVFTIPVLGGIPVSEAVVVSWIIMAVLFLVCIIFVRGFDVMHPGKKQLVLETAVSGIYRFFDGILGKDGREYVPYLMAVAIYVGCANLIGLFGFKPPTKDINVTAALALMSIVLIELAGIRKRGGKGWVKSFAEPIAIVAPINVLAHIVIALQAINSRERNQKEPLILTCGQISAGTAGNIIPESGFITGTIRAFNQEVREQAKRRLVEISDLTARTFGASAEVEWYTEFAPTINDIPLTEELDGYTRELLGDDQVKIQPAQMGSEDFSEVMLRVPGTFFNLSLGSKAAGYTFGAHNPKVRHDEAGLPVGSAVYANIAIEWLAHNR